MRKLYRKIPLVAIVLVVIIVNVSSCTNVADAIDQTIVDATKEGLNSVQSVFDTYEEATEKQADIGVLHEVTLIRVVDGDTIIIINDNNEEETVRLIGIDTPESVNPDESKNNEYGDQASEHTKELLKNTDTVYLEYDEDETDQYGRTLAYVWLKNCENSFDTAEIEGYMLNAIIVKDGYAMAKDYPPNTMYSAELKALCTTAKDGEIGLWSEEGFTKLWE